MATPELKPTRLASADDRPASHAVSKPKAADDQTDEHAAATKHAKSKSTDTSRDADDVPIAKTKTKRGVQLADIGTDDTTAKRHTGTRSGRSTNSDDSDDTTTDKKGRRTAHGRPAAADDSDEPATGKNRKGTHGKADVTDDSGSASKTRKGAHGTKLAATDDSEEDNSPSRKTAHGKKASDDDTDAKPSRSSKKDEEKSAPERVFVQVAGGANKDDMDKAWAGLKKKAPDLMKGHTPQTAPVHATNRLLVGPFKNDDEAQAFVNKMAAKGLSGFTVKTPKGTKVEKVDSGQ